MFASIITNWWQFLTHIFRGKLNPARVDLIAHFDCALCRARSVCFTKLSIDFDIEGLI